MGIAISIIIIAVGAIMHFAITATVGGLKIPTAGTILMVVGVLGLVVSFVMLGIQRGGLHGNRTTVVHDAGAPVVRDGGTTVFHDEVR